MKIAYIANIRLPTEKAHGYQIMRTCAALAAQGAEVTLLVPTRRNPLGKTDPFTYYGIAQRFLIVRLPVADLVGFLRPFIGPLGFWIESFTFARAVKKYLRSKKTDWVYCRDELILKLLGALRVPIALELHGISRHPQRYASLLRRVSLIVVITRALRDALMKAGVAVEKVTVAPDAVALEEFSNLPDVAVSRKALNWPAGKKVALYVGHPYAWKGVFRLAEASEFLSDEWLVIMVGGIPSDLAPLRECVESRRLSRVTIIPHQERRMLSMYYAAADVLVLPNMIETVHSLYTSPLKLFEYLAAGRPIVATALPSFREIVSEKEVIFAKPSDNKDLARAIREAGEYDQSARVAAAKKLAERYTWDGRATTILAALNALPKA